MVIPGNDDAIGAIKLIASIISGAVIEAKEGTVMTAPEDDETKTNTTVDEETNNG